LNDWRSNGKARSTLVSAETAPARIEPDTVSNAVFEDVYDLSLRHLGQVLLRRMWVIVLSAILFAGLAVAYSLQLTPMYAASIKIVVGPSADVDPTVTPPIAELQVWANTMAEAIDSRRIAEATIQRLNLPMTPNALVRNLDATSSAAGSQFIEVTYTDPNRARAKEVANAVGTVLSDNIEVLSPNAEGVTATVWEKAAMPVSPISPDPVANGVVALMVGIVIGVGLAFLLEHLDDRWRSPEEAEQVSGVPTFGVLPKHEVIVGNKRKRGE
jgi:capsular polysaccharide biosynthesis protein